MSKLIYYKADERGHASYDWLDAYHSFSFGRYYDPSKVSFGTLRVLNDDTIAGGRGFGFHPHDNMEIITIPMSGALEHKDNIGNQEVIQAGDIQVMSAGTGIVHSEYNKNTDIPIKLFQIWIETNQQNVKPRYDQRKIELEQNKLVKVVAPYPATDSIWIYQNAFIHLGKFDANIAINYKQELPQNGIYVFLIEGSIDIQGQVMNRRDAVGIIGASEINITSIEPAHLMIIEVPL